MRINLNGADKEELERRVAELQNRGWEIVTPVTPKNGEYFNQGKNGEYKHQHNRLVTTYFAVMEQ